MKRLLTILVLSIPLLGIGQVNNQINKLFRKYANKEGIESFHLGYIPMKLAGFVCKLSGAEEADIINKIDGIRILTVEDEKLNKTFNFYRELEADGILKGNKYEVLMEVTEKDQVVRFFGKTNDKGQITELLLVVGGRENSLINIRGLIDPKDLGKVKGKLNLNVKVL